jgi:hypothetical protein
MFNVDDYYAQRMVRDYEADMRRKLEQKRQLRAIRAERQPAAARLGEWMVRTGTVLTERYGDISDTSPAIQPQHKTVRLKLS